MTSAAQALEASLPASSPLPAPSAKWVEFLVVGGATLVLFPLAWVLRKSVGLDDSELAVGFLMFHAAHVINDPHFAVTYVLFYRNFKQRAFGSTSDAAQRVRYWAAGVVAPLALALWAIGSLAAGSAESLGLLIQLMFLLVGWHYVKQGFGVLTVLSARRGVRFDGRERRAILGHCYAGWAYAWASPADPGRDLEESGVVFRSIPHPVALEHTTFALFLLSASWLAWVLVGKWRRERRVPPLAPLSALLITVWLWSVYSAIDPLMIYVIPALHSLQYLYFVWLLARNEARAEEGPPLFRRPASVRVGALFLSAIALGWLILRALPHGLDAALLPATPTSTDRLGATPYFAACFAFVNLHHYFMDAVIWRRENPDTRHLLT
jgi:hypothetical protein